MLTDLSNDALMCLLVDRTRQQDSSGPQLANAHRRVGSALAPSIARSLPLEAYSIQHVAGASEGIRVRPGCEPVFVAMMRAGLFVAEGLWESFLGAALVPKSGDLSSSAVSNLAGKTVVIVDAVINTGESIRKTLATVAPAAPAKVAVVTLVGYRATVESLVAEYPAIDFICARISGRSYVGKGKTDTGARLFGTTTWSSER